MFVVSVGSDDKLYGPFKTANAAARWARKQLSTLACWSVILVRDA